MAIYIRLFLTSIVWFLITILPGTFICSSFSALLTQPLSSIVFFFPMIILIGLYFILIQVLKFAIKGSRKYQSYMSSIYFFMGLIGTSIGVYLFFDNVLYSFNFQFIFEQVWIKNFRAAPVKCMLVLCLYVILVLYYIYALIFDIEKLEGIKLNFDRIYRSALDNLVRSWN